MIRALAALVAGVTVANLYAQHLGDPTADLDKLSVDELFTLQVTSVGRKAQQLSKAPAAVFVLTAEDIQRSGATCVPEALQLVPGLTVLRLDGRTWLISARGGARVYSDKILVMIDGRSLYTPMFSGVFWDSIDVPLGEIERIEVVRGPGAVMWGPNAVNGVINIITRQAKASRGGQASVTTGNERLGSLEARWGAALSEKLQYRVWGKADYFAPAYGSPGYFTFAATYQYRDPRVDDLDTASGRMGFRVDGQPTPKDRWMVSGDAFRISRHEVVAVPVLVPDIVWSRSGHTGIDGGYLQSSWTHTASAGSERELKFSLSRTNLNYPFVGADLRNLTLDYQQRIQTGERNEIYWGAGFQQYWDSSHSGGTVLLTPASDVFRGADAVIRDEWQFVPGKWTASAGIRVDFSSYRRVDYQPSVRLLYTPDSRHSAWFAASRAVRAPTRLDRDGDLGAMVEFNGWPVRMDMLGSRQFRSEVERSLEAGYRMQKGQNWSVDASVFWSYYGRLRILVGPALPILSFQDGTLHLAMPMTASNAGVGRSYGGELWGTIRVRSGWRLSPSYSYLNDTRWMPSSRYYVYYWDGAPAQVPHQGVLRSEHDLTRFLKLDLAARARSRNAAGQFPGVLLVDARVAWRPTRWGELSLALHNLTDRRVVEALPEVQALAIPIRRTFTLKWTQRF